VKGVLILGAGNAQIDAIEYLIAKDGYEVHVCSWSAEDKGAKLADKFVQINITDADKIQEYVHKNNIDYIYSIGSDLAMPTVAKISARLGLPCFVSPELPMICNNKHLLRDALGEGFEGNIRHITARNLPDLKGWNHYPCVIKPVDSQGQRGVYEVRSANELEKYFDVSMSFSRSKKVIVEEYVDGQEFSVNSFFCHGEMKFSLVSDRIVFDEYPGGIIKEHHVPSLIDQDVKTKILDLVKRSAERLNIREGPAYYQIKLLKNAPKIIEITPRLDGCHMWKLIRHYCNDDLLASTFEYLLEGTEPIFKSDFSDKNLLLEFLCEKPQTIFSKSKYNVDGALELVWYYQDGDEVVSLNGHMEKCGYVVREIAK